MLRIHGLRSRGLAPISLDLPSGACAVVTGPSGSGKTLFLRAIADLDPNDGDVVLDGASRGDVAAPDWRRRAAYLQAETGWWTDIVGDHMPDRAAAAALAATFGLAADALDWPVTRLSTGERQRLALVRLLVLDPALLLLDEPTSALDPDASAAVEAELGRRLAAGAIAVMTSHDPAQAARLATHRLTMDMGGVLAAA